MRSAAAAAAAGSIRKIQSARGLKAWKSSI